MMGKNKSTTTRDRAKEKIKNNKMINNRKYKEMMSCR